MHKENFGRVIDKIKTCPTEWCQDTWHHNEKHCFAGLAQILSGKAADSFTTRADAREWLDLTLFEADYYFHPDRKLEDFQYSYDRISYNQHNYNQYGYDQRGYDQFGFSRHGYDWCGYNQKGYDQFGFSRNGYDKDGRTQIGGNGKKQHQNGYDRCGYDRDGFDIFNIRKQEK